MNNLYWTSMLIQDPKDKTPWIYASVIAALTIDEAVEIIEKKRKEHNVLVAWVRTFDGNNELTVYHKCYVNYRLEKIK